MAVCPRCGSKAYELWTSAECTNPSCSKYVERDEPEECVLDVASQADLDRHDPPNEQSPDSCKYRRTPALERALATLHGQQLTYVHQVDDRPASVRLAQFDGLYGDDRYIHVTGYSIAATIEWIRDGMRLVGQSENRDGKPICITLQFHATDKETYAALGALERHFASIS